MRRAAAVTVLLLAAVVAGLAAVLYLPALVVAQDLGGRGVSAAERLTAINNARTVLVQALGAVILGLGAYATWHRLRINEEELRLSRSGQTTERYSRAVEHLGHDSPDVRIGGIFALEQIARQSPGDAVAIAAILCAYVRGHAPWPPGRPGQPPAGTPVEELPSLAMRANDVQAALTVLAGLHAAAGPARLTLPRADLRFARLNGLSLRGAYLGNSTLERARLYGTDLRESMLRHADLRHAELAGTDLRGAELGGADLRHTDLGTARLAGARADAATQWPDRFDPRAAGVVGLPPT